MNRDELMTSLLSIAREGVAKKLREFSETPAGKVVKVAADEVIAARKEGRTLTPDDLIHFCFQKIPQILPDDPLDNEGGED